MQLVRPINEFPNPIPYKTHQDGIKMVEDLTLGRRFVMQKLAVGMLNVLDQLNREVCFRVLSPHSSVSMVSMSLMTYI